MGIFEELTKTEWLLGGIAVILLLLLVVVLAVLREQRYSHWETRFDSIVDHGLERLGKATEMHAEVAGAVAYLDQIQARPELIANLGEYSRQAIAASLMQRLAILADTIKTVQKELMNHEASLARGYRDHETNVKTCRSQLERLLQDQQALQELADQLAGPKLRAV